MVSVIENQIEIDLISENEMSYLNLLTPSPSSNEGGSPSHSIYYNSPDDVTILDNNEPYLEIVEEPMDRFRFRYKSEMSGTHGSLGGKSTTVRSRKNTFPTVKLHNFNGKKAILRCSLYQYNYDNDYKSHAHRLVMKNSKEETDDPHDVYVTASNDYQHVFHNMGIIHTAKKYLEPELIRKLTQIKEEEISRTEGVIRSLHVAEKVQIKKLASEECKSMNLNVVRLRFDAFVITNNDRILRPICRPIFSQSINNLKSALTGELKIVRMDHCTSPAKGNQEVFILVERVTKKNIKIRFFELDEDDDKNVVWEEYGRFSDLDVHHQYAIVFKTPPYKDLNIKRQVRVFIELERITDNGRSDPKEFTYVPNNPYSYQPGAKRARPCDLSEEFSLPSHDLPGIDNILDLNILHLNQTPMVTSAELQNAINNINSDDFDSLYRQFENPYLSVAIDGPNGERKTTTESIEIRQAKEIIIELEKLVKNKPKADVAKAQLKQFFEPDLRTNALHVLMKAEDSIAVVFVLKLIYFYKLFNLINIRNEEGEALLHIAVTTRNEDLVAILLGCQANVNIEDNSLNTPLHLAVINSASIQIFEKLLGCNGIQVNATNSDGNTAFDLAIECTNFMSLKLLSDYCDINRQHNKNGYTPLRLAIEKENIHFVQYLLSNPNIECFKLDFKQVTPLQAALNKDNGQLKAIVANYMHEHDYPNVEIKSEFEEEFEELREEKVGIKTEQISSDELRDMYKTIQNFTPDCLHEVSVILDKTGNWSYLAELLGLEHLTETDNIKEIKSPAKMLLKNAIETNGATIFDIRNFLEDLDEDEAVTTIDNMVKSQFV